MNVHLRACLVLATLLSAFWFYLASRRAIDWWYDVGSFVQGEIWVIFLTAASAIVGTLSLPVMFVVQCFAMLAAVMTMKGSDIDVPYVAAMLLLGAILVFQALYYLSSEQLKKEAARKSSQTKGSSTI